MKFRIKDVAQEKGYTQKELAEKIGIALPTMKYYYTATSLSTETLEKIASALGVDVWELLEDRNEILSKIKTDTTNLHCPHCGKPISVKLSCETE